MIKIKRKIGILSLGVIISLSSIVFSSVVLNPTIVKASSNSGLTTQANSCVQSLETSLKRNYLGSKNLPTFNSYLKKAKDLTSKLQNGSAKTSLNNRIAETERIIRATEAVVVLENSLDKNHHGVKNLSVFNSYISRANKAISIVKTTICKEKLQDRTYISFNVVRDIEVVNSKEYVAAANGFVNARKEYRIALKDKTKESKEKALENAKNSLELVWKIKTSLAKDYLAKDIRALINDINKIEVKEEIKEEVANPEENNKEEVTLPQENEKIIDDKKTDVEIEKIREKPLETLENDEVKIDSVENDSINEIVNE